MSEFFSSVWVVWTCVSEFNSNTYKKQRNNGRASGLPIRHNTHTHTHTHTHTQTHTQNFRTSNDINIELGGVTKLDKRNATATKKNGRLCLFLLLSAFYLQ